MHNKAEIASTSPAQDTKICMFFSQHIKGSHNFETWQMRSVLIPPPHQA